MPLLAAMRFTAAVKRARLAAKSALPGRMPGLLAVVPNHFSQVGAIDRRAPSPSAARGRGSRGDDSRLLVASMASPYRACEGSSHEFATNPGRHWVARLGD